VAKGFGQVAKWETVVSACGGRRWFQVTIGGQTFSVFDFSGRGARFAADMKEA
jgi:hypothetical protein